jgi:8-oxo-dGTP pyrophosphatase MutT (NUDIX family)
VGDLRRMTATIVDRVYQVAYRSAYRLMRLWWVLRRPRVRGAQIALWYGGELLVIRSSYRAVWELPGGGVQPGESPRDAALRECREEVGIVLPAETLQEAQDTEIVWEHRHDRVTVFEVRLDAQPLPRPDNREIVVAALRSPATLDAGALNPHLARYLAGRV